MTARPRLRVTLLAGIALTLAGTAAQGRIQGVKGRRLQVFDSLAPYVEGVVLVEEPSVVTAKPRPMVTTQGIKWYAHEFLETRLRELPWTVQPWYDEMGPVERHEALVPTLVVSSVVYLEQSLSRPLALELFMRDAASGEIVARYTGFGHSLVRAARAGVRDDLQEITRVLVDQLAAEIGVRPPSHLGGYEPDPYRRRSRSAIAYPGLTSADPPRMFLHGEPPVQYDAPIPTRYRDVPDEVHRKHFEPPLARSRAAGTDNGTKANAQAEAQPSFVEPPARGAHAGAHSAREAPVSPPRPAPSSPSASNTTVYSAQDSGVFHLDPRCRPVRYHAPRKLSLDMALEEGMHACPRCAGDAPASRR